MTRLFQRARDCRRVAQGAPASMPLPSRTGCADGEPESSPIRPQGATTAPNRGTDVGMALRLRGRYLGTPIFPRRRVIGSIRETGLCLTVGTIWARKGI